MILRITELKEKCKIILTAMDSSVFSSVTDFLELVTEDGHLKMNITNKEYFVSVILHENVEESDFRATINALLFLRLISKITTDTVELLIENNNLVIKGNGNYKLPIIYDGEQIFQLPKIEINNVTQNFIIKGDILVSINKYNTRQLSTGVITKPVQKLYYIDENGAITFTSGACVNKFTLTTPIKVLLNQRLVRMFSLFKDCDVNFSMGSDVVSHEITQTKVKFEIKDIIITAILAMDDLSLVPVTSIRDLAFYKYQNTVTINRNEFSQTIDRLLLFSNTGTHKTYSKFKFEQDKVIIFDSSSANNEDIFYNSSSVKDSYEVSLDLEDVKSVVDIMSSSYVKLSFGDNNCVVIFSDNIYNIIPICESV